MIKVDQLIIFVSAIGLVVRAAPIVTVEQGDIVGETVIFYDGDVINTTASIDVFKGIPFADPPVRFAAPVTKKSWDGQWNATYFRPGCMSWIDVVYEPYSVDEDCLYLNVFVPKSKSTNASVMVYFHGGGYQIGTASSEQLSGIPLAAVGNVIVITMNYRLTIFGFFSTGDDVAPGNFGLLDQVEALRWIQKNIAAFGGDPSQITIFGESAGAGSVDFQLFSEMSRNLFSKAILQSGTASGISGYRSDPVLEKEIAINIGKRVGCNMIDSQQLVACLRTIDRWDLFNAHNANGQRVHPNLDGIFITESPVISLARGAFKECPILAGFNKDEGTLDAYSYFNSPEIKNSDEPPFIDSEEFERVLEAFLAPRNLNNALIKRAVKQEYLDWSNVNDPATDYFQPYVNFATDGHFGCLTLQMVKAHAAKKNQPVYLYFMTHEPTHSYFKIGDVGPGWMGASHAEDIPFVFGWGFNPQALTFHSMTRDEKRLSVKFMKFWTNFVKTGNPSQFDPESMPVSSGPNFWPVYSVMHETYKELSFELTVQRKGLRSDECALWSGFIPDLDDYTSSLDQVEADWREQYSGWGKDLNDWRAEFQLYKNEDSCE